MVQFPLCPLSAILQVPCRCVGTYRSNTETAQHWKHNQGLREEGEGRKVRDKSRLLHSSFCGWGKVCEEREYQSDSEGGNGPNSPERINSGGARPEEKDEVQDVLGVSTALPLSKEVRSVKVGCCIHLLYLSSYLKQA